MPNLVPAELSKLKGLLKKRKDLDEPLSKADQGVYDALKGKMRAAVPHDRLHPGFSELPAPEQFKLTQMNKKLNQKKPLTAQEEGVLGQIRDLMTNPIKAGELHPGWLNLNQPEKVQFRNLRDKQQNGDDMEPKEQA